MSTLHKTIHENHGLAVGYIRAYLSGVPLDECFRDERGRRVIAVVACDGEDGAHQWARTRTFQAVLREAMRSTEQIKPPLVFIADDDPSTVMFSVRKRDRARVERKLEDIVNAFGKGRNT